jgi:ElaB/YqjD/DUF883 family membrane-anchored ribosome-binding protein
MSVETPSMTPSAKPSRARKTANGVADAADTAANAALNAESRIAAAAKQAETVIRESLETFRAQTRAYADTAAERFESAQKVVVERVREKPVESTLIAFGAGLVLGVLIAGRRN